MCFSFTVQDPCGLKVFFVLFYCFVLFSFVSQWTEEAEMHFFFQEHTAANIKIFFWFLISTSPCFFSDHELWLLTGILDIADSYFWRLVYLRFKHLFFLVSSSSKCLFAYFHIAERQINRECLPFMGSLPKCLQHPGLG